MSHQLDLAGWVPDQVTQLTQRRVENPLTTFVNSLDGPLKNDILREWERIVQEKTLELDDKQRTQLEAKLKQVPSGLQVQFYENKDDEGETFVNVTWIGPKTWGCTWDHRLMYGNAPCPYDMKSLIFPSKLAYQEFLNKHFKDLTFDEEGLYPTNRKGGDTHEHHFWGWSSDLLYCSDRGCRSGCAHFSQETAQVRDIIISRHDVHKNMQFVDGDWCQQCKDEEEAQETEPSETNYSSCPFN
jgi:hypothetical protein